MSVLDLTTNNWKRLMALAGVTGGVMQLASNPPDPRGRGREITYSSPVRFHGPHNRPGSPLLDSSPQAETQTDPGYLTGTPNMVTTRNRSMKLLSPLVGSEGTTYSHYRFHPKGRKQRFSYNKYTCSRGSFTDHNCYNIKSTVATTVWKFSALINGTNLEAWRAIMPSGDATDAGRKRQLGANATTNENEITTEMNNRVGNSTPIQVHGYQHQFKLQNRNKHPVYVDIWDVSLKGSTSINSNSDPLGLLGLYTSNEGSAPYYYSHGGSSKAQMSYTHPDFKLGWSKEFTDIWTKKHHTRIRLQPGEEHIHTISAKLHFVYDRYSVDNQGITEFEGITQGTLFRAVGDMVHDENVTTNTYLPTIDGTYVDIIEVWKVNVSEVDPWRDVFHLNIAASYPAVGQERDTVARIELENPASVLGQATGP